MEIKEIKEKGEWENFLTQVKEKTFLHSWNWGEFQKKQGNKIWRIGFYNPKLIGISLIIKIKAKRGTFFFIPHGPIILREREGVFKELKNYLKNLEKAHFARFAFIWPKNSFDHKLKKAPIHIHPEITWELNLEEKNLLAKMRKTTRYLIRKGLKNPNIKIEKSNNLQKFYQLYLETAKRHRFQPFSFQYLSDQYEIFSQDQEIQLFLGKYKGEIFSAAIVVFWQGIAFYHHGASLNHKEPISYLLQWQIIQEAKKRSCQKYNFWGIAPGIKEKKDLKNSKHPWAGLTLFKMGFGGYKKEYLKTADLVLSCWYYLTYFFEKIRKIKRRL